MVDNFRPRATVSATHCLAVDAELKSLKLVARKLQAVLTLNSTECLILGRLYYKNNNQHRGAVFWRSLAELRRFTTRLKALDLDLCCAAFRASFHGESNPGAATKKGSWTHLPSNDLTCATLKRVDTAIEFADKMSQRMLECFQVFHASLQSAAFLQLLLTFLAIAARLRTIALELHEVLLPLQATLRHVASILSAPTSQPEVEKEQPVADIEEEMPQLPDDNVVAAQATIVVKQREKSVSGKPHNGEPAPQKEKKKRKKAKDEIDDIFGF